VFWLHGTEVAEAGRGAVGVAKRPASAAIDVDGRIRSARVQVWSYDFVFDHCANGQQLKCLTVTDEFTKEGLAPTLAAGPPAIMTAS
jgi:hypothetical protein